MVVKSKRATQDPLAKLRKTFCSEQSSRLKTSVLADIYHTIITVMFNVTLAYHIVVN